MDRELSTLYTRYAARQYQADEREQARELALTALLYQGDNPDALYMVGATALEAGRAAEAEEHLSEALVHDTWRFFTREEARLELAEALFRQGKTQEAYHLLSPYRAVNVRYSPEFLMLYSRILRTLGKNEELRRSLQDGLRRYPQHGGLQALHISIDREYARQALDRILEGDQAGRYGREAYAELIRSSSGEERRRLLQRYEERWQPDRFSRLYSLLAEGRQSPEAYASFFSSVDSLPGDELQRLISEAQRQAPPDGGKTEGENGDKAGGTDESETGSTDGGGSAGDALQEGFASFSGTIEYDRDNDGTIERTEQFQRGEPRELRVMHEESGEKYTAEFSGGEPERFSVVGERTVEIIYEQYPRVERVRWQREEGILDVKLVPYEYRYPLFVSGSGDYYRMPALQEELEFPAADTLLPHASAIERREGGVLSARYDRRSGRAVFTPAGISRDTVATYRDAELEKREMKYRGEETARITEYYRQGELQTLLYDGNGNGTPELIEHHGREILQMWDFDEDGSIDYETTITGTGAE
jgi:Ca2+-binding EF-hand superfamily protein